MRIPWVLTHDVLDMTAEFMRSVARMRAIILRIENLFTRVLDEPDEMMVCVVSWS